MGTSLKQELVLVCREVTGNASEEHVFATEQPPELVNLLDRFTIHAGVDAFKPHDSSSLLPILDARGSW